VNFLKDEVVGQHRKITNVLGGFLGMGECGVNGKAEIVMKWKI
jgi:hypothetical protein